MYQWLPNICMCDRLPIHHATRTRTAGPVTAPCPAGSRTALCTCTLSCACARSGGRAVPAPASQAYKTAAQCARRSRTIVSWLIFRDLAPQSYDRQLAHLQRSRSAVVRSSAGSSCVQWLLLSKEQFFLCKQFFFCVEGKSSGILSLPSLCTLHSWIALHMWRMGPRIIPESTQQILTTWFPCMHALKSAPNAWCTS